MKKLTLDEAEKLAMETEYAELASEQEINPINIGDAGAFFLEGYYFAMTQLNHEENENI